MFDRTTRYFLCWRDRGDPAALSRVFDRTAPELMRLALHLGRNATDAEDLVQATFLAAIESAGRFDRSRRLLPWLASILTHRAQAERRRRDRDALTGNDPETVPGRDEDPAHAAVHRELTSATLAAIDRLAEPCRQATMLRVVHGLEPAAIAVLLQRSPGTVRAQIHRGLEQLRRILPAGVASALACTANAMTRGLPAVKTIVLAHARLVPAARVALVGTAPLLTGLAMSKNLGLAAIGLLCCVSVFLLNRPDPAPRPIVAGTSPAPAAAATAEAPAVPGAGAGAPTAVAAAREAAPGPDTTWQFAAQVVDGATRQPVADATVRMFAPRMATLLDLQREFRAYGVADPRGRLRSPLSWLRLPDDLPDEVTAGGASHPFTVPPAPDAPVLAKATTDAAGRFTVPVSVRDGMLTIEQAGYGTRHVPVPPTTADEQVVCLWPLRPLVGFVRTDFGEVPPEPIALLLTAEDSAALVETDANGRFATTIAGQRAHATSRTPGWTVTSTRRNRSEPGSTGVALTSLGVDEEGTILVARFGGTRLHVTDATTGKAIVCISLRSVDEHDRPRHGGSFLTADGWYTLQFWGAEDALEQTESLHGQGRLPTRARVTIWSEGYAAVDLGELPTATAEPRVVEVRLQRGELAMLTGSVQSTSGPLPGVTVRLRTFHHLNWQSSRDNVLAVGRTDTDGGFALRAPAGTYLFEVLDGTRELVQCAVQLPHEGPLRIDVDRMAHVDIEVVDAQGQPRADHNVSVQGRDDQQRSGRTDANGHVVLGPFAPGPLLAFAPLEVTQGSWVGRIRAKVDATTGGVHRVTLRLTPPVAIRARLCFDGPAPPSGFAKFLARPMEARDPVPVAPDGAVPIDLRPGDDELEVTSPDGRRWRFDLPQDARPEHVFTLRWSGLGYAGVATDMQGKPIAGGRVFAAPDNGGPTQSAVTDAQGAFALQGLEAANYTLSVHASADGRRREGDDNVFSMAFFVPNQLPAMPPPRVTIAVPAHRGAQFVGLGTIEISGRVLGEGQAPVAQAIVSVQTLFDQDGGRLELLPLSGWKRTAEDGTFRLVVARGMRYRSTLLRKMDAQEQEEEWTIPGSPEAWTRDLHVK